MVAILSADDRFEITGTASSVAGFRTAFPGWNPTVVVADYRLPDGKGTDLVALSDKPILLISGMNGPAVLQDALESGCAGFASKSLPAADLVRAIVAVEQGATVFPTEVLEQVSTAERRGRGRELTAREIEVLELLAQARPVPEIATELTVSLHTVRNHIRSVLMKLQARSQLEAVVTAVREGIVQIEP